MIGDAGEHWRKLERMYRAAPVNAYFKPDIAITDGSAVVSLLVRPDFHHAAGAAHGAIYFKLLDDATFFAASSVEREVFLLTARFDLTFRKPVVSGAMIATGRIVSHSARRCVAEGSIVNDVGEIVAEGVGEFARSGIALGAELGYR